MIGHSELSGSWYVVTDYKPGRVPGTFAATRKHRLGPDQSKQLDWLLELEGIAHEMACLLNEVAIDGRTSAGRKRKNLRRRYDNLLRLARTNDPVL
jgi:hypothetical protein